jgi:hypothetical protein
MVTTGWLTKQIIMKKILFSKKNYDILFALGFTLFITHLFFGDYLREVISGYLFIVFSVMIVIVFWISLFKNKLDSWVNGLYILLLFKFFFGDILREFTPWYPILYTPVVVFFIIMASFKFFRK